MKNWNTLMFFPEMPNGDDLETGWPRPHLDHVSVPACIQTPLIFP